MELFINKLFEQPAFYFATIASFAGSICIHEYCHAFVAHHLGDSTAKEGGYMTLNPLKVMGWMSIAHLHGTAQKFTKNCLKYVFPDDTPCANQFFLFFHAATLQPILLIPRGIKSMTNKAYKAYRNGDNMVSTVCSAALGSFSPS